jgi:hypothetical protein
MDKLTRLKKIALALYMEIREIEKGVANDSLSD